MTLKTFKRYENKYLLNNNQYNSIISVLQEHMEPDEHSVDGGSYSVYNIYYDTDNNDIIRHSLSKPYYKEKLRLRSYKIPSSLSETVCLELKKKIGGIVSKRRTVIPLEDAIRFVSTGEKPAPRGYLDKQVVNEIFHFLSLYNLQPRVFISYDRRAFFGTDDNSLRVTLDKNIKTRRYDLDLQSGDHGESLIGENQYLMEIKVTHSIPMWLARILSEEKIYSISFSKYGMEYKKYSIEGHGVSSEVNYKPNCIPSPMNLKICVNQ